MTNFLSITDINTSINHEPRMLDLKLAEALGMKRPRKIRELIIRHIDNLKRFSSIAPHRGAVGEDVYYLNKKPENWRAKDINKNASLALQAINNLIKNIEDNHTFLNALVTAEKTTSKGSPVEGMNYKYTYILKDNKK